MNFHQFVLQNLISCGMSDNQAHTVFMRCCQDDNLKSMNGRWFDLVEDFPPVMQNVIWIGIKRIALQWIDENIPQAFFRPMFVVE